MKRLHVHVSVDDLDRSTAFYAALFGGAPTVLKTDYAKWELEDPRVNFAISARGGRAAGVDHLGVQVETGEELDAMAAALAAADVETAPEPDARCCYARSDKHWARDPSGVVWETFRTMEAIETYGGATPAARCCG